MTDRTEALDIEAEASTIQRCLGELDSHETFRIGKRSLDRLIQALKASNEERERVRDERDYERTNRHIMLVNSARDEPVIDTVRQMLACMEDVDGCRRKLSLSLIEAQLKSALKSGEVAAEECRAALSHPISPERSDEGPEK